MTIQTAQRHLPKSLFHFFCVIVGTFPIDSSPKGKVYPLAYLLLRKLPMSTIQGKTITKSESKGLLKTLVARGLLTFAIITCLLAFFTARAWGLNLELVVTGAASSILVLAMLLERWLPFRDQWNHKHNDIRTDVTSTTVLFALIDPLLKYISPVATVALYTVLDLAPTYSSLFGDTAFWLQLLLITLFIELARYWLHRLHHTLGWLWWLHAMHHSSTRLYALNNFRFHPLNYMLMFMFSTFPLMLLGVPGDLLLAYLALSLPIIMLQHANIDLKNGLLNYLFSTNELHRWHHSARAAQANCNYGHALIIWDQLFGTFKYYSETNNMPDEVGLFKSSSQTYPAQASYLTQLRSMFCWKCCRV